MKPLATFIDCFSPLTAADAKALKTHGYAGVIRYLGAKTHPEFGKGITLEELHSLTEASLKVVFNWEGNSTSRAYFTSQQGAQDAKDTLTELAYLGIAPNSNIVVYYSVDYDAYTQADFDAVDNYLVAVEKELGGTFGYGVYGGLPVLQYLSSGKAKAKPTRFWQTIAWSGGRLFSHANLYQNKVETRVSGISVDVDQVLVEPGWYPVDPPPEQKPEPTLKEGSKGAAVKTLQEVLNKHGAKPQLVVDGVFGQKTLEAVKAFQASHHLTVDGIAGPQTWAALNQN
ncbi:MAG: DUF1906 domain-containing protein [Alicyclobacillus sp.]|nr:DUF1906 domain-containing protein [Alicyclobacillus sp.]